MVKLNTLFKKLMEGVGFVFLSNCNLKAALFVDQKNNDLLNGCEIN